MKKLISIAKHSDWLDKSPYINNRKWELHRQRVDFGKQPLALWMFVPCKLVDGVWKVLEYPDDAKDYIFRGDSMRHEDLQEYQQAKERCLFEGFSEKDAKIALFANETIEDLIEFNLTLTKTAQI